MLDETKVGTEETPPVDPPGQEPPAPPAEPPTKADAKPKPVKFKVARTTYQFRVASIKRAGVKTDVKSLAKDKDFLTSLVTSNSSIIEKI